MNEHNKLCYPQHIRNKTYGVKAHIADYLTRNSFLNFYEKEVYDKGEEEWLICNDMSFRFTIKWTYFGNIPKKGSLGYYMEPVAIIEAFKPHWKRVHIFNYLLREYPLIAQLLSYLNLRYPQSEAIQIESLPHSDAIDARNHINDFLTGQTWNCGCYRCSIARKQSIKEYIRKVGWKMFNPPNYSDRNFWGLYDRINAQFDEEDTATIIFDIYN